jgi:protein-tyrosine kinase
MPLPVRLLVRVGRVRLCERAADSLTLNSSTNNETMSKIEEALERAMQIRETETKPHQAPKPPVTEPPRDSGAEQRPAAPLPSHPQTGPVPVRVQNPALVAISDPGSQVAEEYRKLKEMVIKMTRTGEGVKNVLMVTSALAGEGKTVTSLNLAACLAQEYDHTVLVIDADVRKPSCASTWESSLGWGSPTACWGPRPWTRP